MAEFQYPFSLSPILVVALVSWVIEGQNVKSKLLFWEIELLQQFEAKVLDVELDTDLRVFNPETGMVEGKGRIERHHGYFFADEAELKRKSEPLNIYVNMHLYKYAYR